MRPKKQNRLEFVDKCNCICDLALLEKAMLWYSDDILFSKRVIRLHEGYPSVAMGGNKVFIHRILKSYKTGRKLEREECVHHIDGNKLNNNLENLETTTQGDHIRTHRKGVKQDKDFAIMRTNASCLSRYGHNTKEFNELNAKG